MTFKPVRQLGERGINTDLPPYELAINEFSAGRNIRFANGSAQTMPLPTVKEALAETPVWGDGWIAGGAPKLAYASATKLYVKDTGAFADKSGAVYSAGDWQSEVWGESIIFNNGIDAPQILEPADVTFKALPNWPAGRTAKTIRAYKNFLVALGVTEGGNSYPNTPFWSTEAEPGAVPATWDVTDTTALAGANPVDSGAGELLDCAPLGNANILYSADATYIMLFTGGQYVFSFDRLFNQGIIARNAVAAFEKYHFVVGSTEIFIHDGNTTRPIAHRRVNKTFYSELAQRDKVRCVANHKTKEVWVYYSTSDTGSANRALVYNWLDNTFTFVDLPGVVCAAFAPRLGEVTTWADLAGTTWAELTQSWGELADTSIYPVMYYFTDTELQESDFLATTGATQTVYLERTGIDLDDFLPGVPTKQWKLLKQLVPQISGTGIVAITIGGSDTPMGPVRWRTPTQFNIDTDLKVDVRVKARYLAIRIQSAGSGFWRLTGWDVDLTPVDGR